MMRRSDGLYAYGSMGMGSVWGMAPEAGLEPAAKRLTAACSTN